MAFLGSLTELPLPDVIQVLQGTNKTGTLRVRQGELKGEIHLQDGRMVDAHCSGLDGEEAVYEISLWGQGDFVFEPGPVSDRVTIHRTNHNLLLEATRRLDEWALLQRHVPSIRAVPQLTPEAIRQSATLHPKERELLRQIDGRRSIETLALDLSISPFEVAKMVFGLLTSGMARLRVVSEDSPYS